MTPERWHQITAIFHGAVARREDLREAYLREACQADPSLRDDVEALLAEHQDGGSLGAAPLFVVAPYYTPLAQGDVIGGYRVDALIGAGGMGAVYRAFDEKLKRTVAIKVMADGALATEDQRLRFIREARAASALNHPNIVAIYDIGRASDRDYIAMEYVSGAPLHDALPRQGVAIDRALEIAVQIARAMAAAHAAGLVHRDLKPANILVTSDGHVKVIDFGIAKQAHADAHDGRTETALPTTRPGAMVGGTPGYAAPEQIDGRPVGAAADVFAIGAILYEMLAGRRAFQGDTTASTLAAVLHETPPALRVVRPDVPRDVQRLVTRCLEKNPKARYSTAGALLDALVNAQRRDVARRVGLGLALRRPAVAITLVTALVVVASVGARIWQQQARARRARMVTIPEAQRLAGEGRNFAAYRTLREAERAIPDDPVLRDALAETTTRVGIRTNPPGAMVYVRDLLEPDNWELLGSAPLEAIRVPADDAFVWKISLDGYQPLETLRSVSGGTTALAALNFTLQPMSSAPANMVFVPGQQNYGLRSLAAVTLPPYWIDRTEVTNRQFKAFIDAGGYTRREHWPQPFVGDGVVLSWEQALATFRDPTGRPGPRTWDLGGYPEGHDDYPVGGVSWYEAAAYCASVGKRLPTIYHWSRAASLDAAGNQARHGNFGLSGPEPVGGPLRIGRFGAYDLAGNVAEWAWNEARDQRRYLLGGGWNEPNYTFLSHGAHPPLEREPAHGLRCMLASEDLSPSVMARTEIPRHDYRSLAPADDRDLAIFRRLYEYKKSPVDAVSEQVDEVSPYWRLERVSFAAAYGNERVTALIFIPTVGSPPYQTVIWFPDIEAFRGESKLGNGEAARRWFSFFPRGGRAVVLTAVKGSYERRVRTGTGSTPSATMVEAVKDIGRTIDYLQTRPELFDTGKLAYAGMSVGGANGPIMTTMEPRFKVGILIAAGLQGVDLPPQVNPFNFLPHVRVPTLMINGKYDNLFEYEASQKLMFDLLGTPKDDKRHMRFEGNHFPFERQQVHKAALDWLDKYFGPVRSR